MHKLIYKSQTADKMPIMNTVPSVRKFSAPLSLVLSIYSWVGCVVLTVFFTVFGALFCYLPSLLSRPPRTLSLMHRVSRRWAIAMISGSPFWKIEVRGLEHIQKDRQYIVVTNHQSLLDIIAVLAGIPLNFKFIAKKELFRVPFLGWFMSLAGYVPLDRGKRESAREVLEASRRWLDRGASLLFFPEGTRSRDGKIREFKVGAFKLASEKQIPILPVVIHGTGDAIPKHSLLVRKGSRFRVTIGEPVPPPARPEKIVQTLKKTRQSMIERLDALRREQRKNGS